MRILVVEDEAAVRAQIVQGLSAEGFTVDEAEEGETGLHLAETSQFDAVVLDLGLPLLDGASVLRALRGGGVDTPVLILTARGSWRDRVEGLDAGGDDYLGKPFHMEELVARIRALIRRSAGRAANVLAWDGLEIDIRAGKARRDGVPVELTANEFKLLTALMLRPGEIHGKADLAEQIYGYYEERDSNTIEVFVGRLRRKLGGDVIRTVRGLGYSLGGGGPS